MTTVYVSSGQKVSGAILLPGDGAYVLAGGTLQASTATGALVVLQIGGVGRQLNMSSGSTLLDGGVLSGATIRGSASLRVTSDGYASGVTVLGGCCDHRCRRHPVRFGGDERWHAVRARRDQPADRLVRRHRGAARHLGRRAECSRRWRGGAGGQHGERRQQRRTGDFHRRGDAEERRLCLVGRLRGASGGVVRAGAGCAVRRDRARNRGARRHPVCGPRRHSVGHDVERRCDGGGGPGALHGGVRRRADDRCGRIGLQPSTIRRADRGVRHFGHRDRQWHGAGRAIGWRGPLCHPHQPEHIIPLFRRHRIILRGAVRIGAVHRWRPVVRRAYRRGRHRTGAGPQRRAWPQSGRLHRGRRNPAERQQLPGSGGVHGHAGHFQRRGWPPARRSCRAGCRRSPAAARRAGPPSWGATSMPAPAATPTTHPSKPAGSCC